MQDIINSGKVAAVPVMTHPGIEIIGETVRKAVTDGETHHRASKARADNYPPAAAPVRMDLTVEAEAFGAEISFPENEVPAVIGHLLDSP